MSSEHACLVEALKQKAQTFEAKSRSLSTEIDVYQGRLDDALCELEVRQKRRFNLTDWKLEDVFHVVACTEKMNGSCSYSHVFELIQAGSAAVPPSYLHFYRVGATACPHGSCAVPVIESTRSEIDISMSPLTCAIFAYPPAFIWNRSCGGTATGNRGRMRTT